MREGGLLEIHIWNKGVVAGEIFTRKPQYPGTKGPATARGPMPNNLFCRSSPILERENRKLSTVINFMEI